jgi:hypothetical protein
MGGYIDLEKYNLKLKQCCGESFEINKQNFNDFLVILKEKIKQYGEKNVFNCDETALFLQISTIKKPGYTREKWSKKV